MNRNFHALRSVPTVLGLVTGIGIGQASAQMPAPLLDTVSPKAAALQLEAMLQCKAGMMLKPHEVETRLRDIGMAKGVDGFMLPSANGARPVLFGGEVVAALIATADGEIKATVYLKGPLGKQMAKKLGVRQIDEQGNTDEPSYFKQTSKKNTLLVGAASEVFLGNESITYQSAVACQQLR